MSYLNRAAKHSDHEHSDAQILRQDVPPGLQNPELRVLF